MVIDKHSIYHQHDSFWVGRVQWTKPNAVEQNRCNEKLIKHKAL